MPIDDEAKLIEPGGAIRSVTCFLNAISALPKSEHKFLYRGHADCTFKLQPSIGRKQYYASQQTTFSCDQEVSLLHRFRRRAYPHVERAITAGEALFLARHHGLPTRLLDWTANALYALYFACIAHAEKHGNVWVLRRHTGTEDQDLDAFDLIRFKDEKELFGGLPVGDAIKIVYPFYNSPRLVAQDGAFTIHSNPWKPIECYSEDDRLAAEMDIEKLYRFLVAKNSKSSIVKELSSLGITHRAVYPDLDGLARSLWETEVLWNGRRRFAPGSDP